MDSQSHAEHLDENYRYQRHVYDLTREYYLLGRKRLIGGLKPPAGGRVLEIGCGTALNLIRAQKLYPDAALFGVDLSRMMLETATAALQRRGLEGKIRLALGDATDFDASTLLGQDRFERVFFSYSLSMIPPWEQALEHASGLLADNGELHVVDFGSCEALPRAAKAGLYAWLAKFKVMPRETLKQALAQVAQRHHLDVTFERLYRGYSYYAVLRRAQG